jgi:hypothetical protein
MGSAEAARRSARRGYLRHKLKDGMRRIPHLAMEMDLASGVRDFSEVGRAEQRRVVLVLAPKVIEACEMMRLAWDDVPDLLDEELFPESKTSKRIGTRTDKGHTGDLFAIASEGGASLTAGTPTESIFAPLEAAAAPPPSRFAPMNLITTKEERDNLAKNPPPKVRPAKK